MMTVKEMAARTHISVRTLHHYDAIGLLRPTEISPAGYRLYDEKALERLYLILLVRVFLTVFGISEHQISLFLLHIVD